MPSIGFINTGYRNVSNDFHSCLNRGDCKYENIFGDGFSRLGKKTVNNIVYEGEFHDWKLHGSGKIIWGEGNTSEGKFEEDRLVEGTVIYQEVKYVGKFGENGTLIEGTMTFTDGTVYSGCFENHCLIDGKMMFPSGIIHEGSFRDNQLEGGGKIFWDNNGNVSEGLFERGRLIEGAVIYQKVKYEGKFGEDGTLANGIITLPNGKLKGVFDRNGLMRGTIYNSEGSFFEGSFAPGEEFLPGKITSNEKTIEGNFIFKSAGCMVIQDKNNKPGHCFTVKPHPWAMLYRIDGIKIDSGPFKNIPNG